MIPKSLRDKRLRQKMANKINNKCLECSKTNWRVKNNKEPSCYIKRVCGKKRSYYRNIEHYRAKLRAYHRYLKFLGDKCFVCGSKDKLEAHHIEPQAMGGEDIQTNIVTLCSVCHKVISIYHRRLGISKKLIE